MWIKKQRGISLLEVLAAIFVVSIGLLGVLAVIPFGAFQMSKAYHAGYASNMLANAAEEIIIRKMAKPKLWGIEDVDVGSGIVLKNMPASPPEYPAPYLALNCTKFLWYELNDVSDPPNHIFSVSTWVPANWTDETMRGQDDLLYTTYGDKRPDFDGQNKKIQSSGKYTWFFTYLPLPTRKYLQTYLQDVVTDITGASPGSDPTNTFTPQELEDALDQAAENAELLEAVPLEKNVRSPTFADVLACHNRVPTEDVQVPIPSGNFSSSQGGGTFTFPNADHWERLSQTKYVFITWRTRIPVSVQVPEKNGDDWVWSRKPVRVGELGGAWCKIVFLDKSDPSKPKIVVTGNLPNVPRSDMHVYIPSGVLYHKRVERVPIR